MTEHQFPVNPNVNVAWYKDVEEFMSSFYGIEVDIQNCEYGQYTYLGPFSAYKTLDDSSEIEAVNEYIEKWVDESYHDVDFEFDLSAIFKDLANKDAIPEGKYLITIWW